MKIACMAQVQGYYKYQIITENWLIGVRRWDGKQLVLSIFEEAPVHIAVQRFALLVEGHSVSQFGAHHTPHGKDALTWGRVDDNLQDFGSELDKLRVVVRSNSLPPAPWCCVLHVPWHPHMPLIALKVQCGEATFFIMSRIIQGPSTCRHARLQLESELAWSDLHQP